MIVIDKNPAPRKLLWFNLLWFPAFVALVGFLVVQRSGSLRAAIVVWSIGAVLVITGMLVRRVRLYLWIGILYLTFPIGWVVSHLLLSLVYYLVLTPIGLLLRLFGRDPMNRKLDRRATSYWQVRESDRDPKSYLRQS